MSATAWALCPSCACPQLAPAHLFEPGSWPRCAFCGADVWRTDGDLSGWAEDVIAEPVLRHRRRFDVRTDAGRWGGSHRPA